MAEPPLLIERDAGIVTLTLNRSEKRNALSEALLDALEQAIAGLASDNKARVVVLAAKGEVFSSGHDLEPRCVDVKKRNSVSVFRGLHAGDARFTSASRSP